MSLAPGTKLGPYEIGVPLGAGGMGEVYRARDTRLDRTVAIKILPANISADPLAKQRFEREAKTISGLNHPNICTLHDVGSQDGVDYLVMECVEGETLAKRLEKGPLPLEQVLKYGMQIADALDKAHRSGVVHRDLKPSNVMLTPSGAKLLDFGLAKAVQTALAGEISSLVTLSKPFTAEGTIIGTIPYMAPEQLEGKEADVRTDIFALGALLYEITTGRRAFEGKSQASLIAAILEKEPTPISELQPMSPAGLDQVIKTCLAKDPEDRWQAARDVKLQLGWIGATLSLPDRAANESRGRIRVAWASAGALAIISLSLLVMRWLTPQYEPTALRAFIVPPENATFSDDAASLAVSPDGTRMVFVAQGPDGKRQLWIRPLDSISAMALPGTESASYPFWSPDGQWIAFFMNGKLRKMPASGGTVTTLCDASQGRGGNWGRDGQILFSPSVADALYLVSAAGGPPKPATKLDPSRKEVSHRWPVFLPDGRHFLFYIRGSETGIYVGKIDSDERKLLVRNLANGLYAPPGYLLYVRDRTLVAQAFNPRQLEVMGEPAPLVENTPVNGTSGSVVFSVSNTGVLAYETGIPAKLRQLSWVDRDGTLRGTVGEPGFAASPRISPDGEKFALTLTDPQETSTNVWVYDIGRGVRERLTFDPSFTGLPNWSPDGKSIIFASNREGAPHMYEVPSNGMGQPRLISDPSSYDYPTSWSADGRYLAFMRRAARNWEVWIMPFSGDRKPFTFLTGPFSYFQPAFSADVHWLAYQSDETGQYEVYVTTFPKAAGKWRISASGGTAPVWRSDGKELYYVAPDRTLMAAEVNTLGQDLKVGAVHSLFNLGTSQAVGEKFEVAHDGKFLVARDVPDLHPAPMVIVVNWTAELKK